MSGQLYAFAAIICVVNLFFTLAGFYIVSTDIDGVFVGWIGAVVASIALAEVYLGVAAGV